MGTKINLLPKEADKVVAINRGVAGLKIACEVILGIIIVVNLGLFGYFFWLNTSLANYEKKVTALVRQIESESETERNYRRLQTVLTVSGGIIESRRDFQSILNDLYALLPGDVGIGGVNFADEVLVFEGQSSGVNGMATALRNFKAAAEDPNSRFGDMVLASVHRGDKGDYDFKIEIDLEKTKSKK